MNASTLSVEERQNIDAGAWFAKLSLPLREAILSRAVVRRLKDGASLVSRGAAAEEWCGVALGAVRISSVSLTGKQVTLTYAEPGVWFGDIALVRRPAAHARRRRPRPDHAAGRAQARLQGTAVAACGAVRRAVAPELPPPAADVQPVRGLEHAAAAGRGWPSRSSCWPRATALPRARRSASACNWRRKTWRSCWVRRASASTRSSRASSATARCASSPRGWWCCRATSCCRSPTAEPATADDLEERTTWISFWAPSRWPARTPSTRRRCRPTCRRTCPASPAR